MMRMTYLCDPMRIYLLIPLLFVFSCGKKQDVRADKPQDLIPQPKMVQVLSDVHILEATLHVIAPGYANARPVNLPGIKDPSISPAPPVKDSMPYYNIFRKYDVTRDQFKSSMKWYCSNPEELNSLYDEVIVELTKRQATDQMKPVKRKDSVKKK